MADIFARQRCTRRTSARLQRGGALEAQNSSMSVHYILSTTSGSIAIRLVQMRLKTQEMILDFKLGVPNSSFCKNQHHSAL